MRLAQSFPYRAEAQLNSIFKPVAKTNHFTFAPCSGERTENLYMSKRLRTDVFAHTAEIAGGAALMSRGFNTGEAVAISAVYSRCQAPLFAFYRNDFGRCVKVLTTRDDVCFVCCGGLKDGARGRGRVCRKPGKPDCAYQAVRFYRAEGGQSANRLFSTAVGFYRAAGCLVERTE